jgi:hypothetical protein
MSTGKMEVTFKDKEKATGLSLQQAAFGNNVVMSGTAMIFEGSFEDCIMYIEIEFSKLPKIKYK